MSEMNGGFDPDGMAVIVPTRHRPANITRLLQAWTATRAEAVPVIAWDDDDESGYTAAIGAAGYEGKVCTLVCSPHSDMATVLNNVARDISQKVKYIGFMGDDHLPRTRKWDVAIRRELRRGGTIVYGNDLMQGPLLPTAVFMTSDIINILGYMVPPGFDHLFLDNCWKAWGEALRARDLWRFRYMPDVVIEHMHPQAAGNKAEWDEGYERVNSGDMWDHDAAAWMYYQHEGGLAADIEKLRAL